MNSEELENKIGFVFSKKELLTRALTHRSYLNENRGRGLRNNERLEFLGDAVLELVISSELYHKYPDKPEGDLTAIRSAVVRTESLAEESRRIGVGEHLLMSKGEEDSGGRDKDYLLANAFEALLGAIYLDKGIDECQKFIERTLLKKLEHIVDNDLFIDPKTKVQEVIQAQHKVTPVYEIIKEHGPDHDKYFTVRLKMGGKTVSTGFGPSKQKAEEDAAQKALDLIEKEDVSLN